MKIRILLAAALIALAAAAPARAQTAADSAAIRATALDYVEGWYSGNGERMRSALHPELAKRISMRGDDGTWRLQSMTAVELVAGTARGGGARTPEAQRQRDVVILDIFENAASVRATMSGGVDYTTAATLRDVYDDVSYEVLAEAMEMLRNSRKGPQRVFSTIR